MGTEGGPVTYAKFDDLSPEDPEIARLSDRDHRAWFDATCYCARNLTDGFILLSIAKKLLGRSLPSLLQLGRLRDVGDGTLEVVGFLKVNDSRETVERRLERARKGAAGRASSLASSFPSSGASSSSPSQLEALPSTPLHSTEVQEDLKAGAFREETPIEEAWEIVPIGWTAIQTALVRKLAQNVSEKWRFTGPALASVNDTFGYAVVTMALQRMFEERRVPTEITGRPLLLTVCRAVKQQQDSSQVVGR